jgi:hypothetical protein
MLRLMLPERAELEEACRHVNGRQRNPCAAARRLGLRRSRTGAAATWSGLARACGRENPIGSPAGGQEVEHTFGQQLRRGLVIGGQ